MAQLEQYRIFTSVAKNKSFGKAASELFITQPAVSQSIKQLENELGVCLFVRTPKGVYLTEAGEVLYLHAERAISILNSGKDRINEIKNLECGTLAIGASDTLCEHYLLPYLRTFHEKYNGINLRITNRTSKETVSLLNGGHVDIGFINLPCDVGDNIEIKKLSKLKTCFVCDQKTFPMLCETTVSAETLSSFPILMLEKESAMRRYADLFFKSNNIVLNPQTELGSHDLLLSFASIGLGVALVVKEYANDFLRNGKLKEIITDFNMPCHELGLITRKTIPLTAAAKAFTDIIG